MERIDLLIKEKYGISRQKAAELIKEDAVSVNGAAVSKPSARFDDNADIKISDDNDTMRYAGRGGLKLAAAVESFKISVDGLVCIDIGASTGGFTDCMLQNGAKCVYAVDVGTAQLIDRLKNDKRVFCFEQTNITDFACPQKADLIACDVSFVSLEKILPEINRLLSSDGSAVVLIKPQFEAGREHLSKNGIVRDKKVHKNVIARLVSAAAQNGLYCAGLDISPIKGGDGNTEYLMYLKRTPQDIDIKNKVNYLTEK